MTTPEVFFLDQLPQAWNRRLPPGGAPGASFGLVLDIARRDALHLEVTDGEMAPAATPVAAPLARVSLELRDFERIVEVAGIDLFRRSRPLSLRFCERLPGRVAALRRARAALQVRVEGARGFAFRVELGDARASVSTASVSLDEADYRKLRDGSLDWKAAFFQGKLGLSGDADAFVRLAISLL